MLKKIHENYLAIFPTIIFILFINIYYNGEIFRLSNINSVIFIFFFCLPFVNKKLLKLKKDLIPLYIFFLMSFLSTIFVESKEMQIISLKRLFIIFFPSFLIVHNYANHPEIEKVFEKIKIYFVFFVFILCIYALVIFLLDLPNLRLLTESSHEVTKTKLFNLGQIYYTRDDIFGDANAATKQGHKLLYWYRPSSLISNTVGFSQLILFASIFLLDNNKIKNGFLSKIVLLVFIICLIWTLSRINLLIFFILIPFIIFFINNNKILFFFVIFISLSYFIVFYSNDFNFINNLYHLTLIGNLFDRFEIYKSSLENLNEFYLRGLGFGLSNELFLSTIHGTLTEHNRSEQISIPSVSIAILLETGIIGLLSYIMITGYSILNNKYDTSKSILERKTIIILLISIFCTQFFDCSLFRFHPTTFFFLVILGININKTNKSFI